MAYWGFCGIGNTLIGLLQTNNSSSVPGDADAAPNRQVYGPSGQVLAASGQASLQHSGTITNATNASPIVVTAAGHGLKTGARVTISGVGGNTNANGSFNATVVDANTFSLDGTTGNANYTSGGSFHMAGLYQQSIVCSAGNGFVSGQTYFCVSTWLISSSARTSVDSFTVT